MYIVDGVIGRVSEVQARADEAASISIPPCERAALKATLEEGRGVLELVAPSSTRVISTLRRASAE